MLLLAHNRVLLCKPLNKPDFRLNHRFRYGATWWESHHPHSRCSGDRPGSCLSKSPSLVSSLPVEVLKCVDRFHDWLILPYCFVFVLLTLVLLLSKVTKRKCRYSWPQADERINTSRVCYVTLQINFESEKRTSVSVHHGNSLWGPYRSAQLSDIMPVQIKDFRVQPVESPSPPHINCSHIIPHTWANIVHIKHNGRVWFATYEKSNMLSRGKVLKWPILSPIIWNILRNGI